MLLLGFPGGASGKEPTCQCRGHKIHSFDPWVEKIPWRRAWQPTPVFLPGMDRGAWQATVHRVTESWIRLKWLSTHAMLLSGLWFSVCTLVPVHSSSAIMCMCGSAGQCQLRVKGKAKLRKDKWEVLSLSGKVVRKVASGCFNAKKWGLIDVPNIEDRQLYLFLFSMGEK